MSFSLRSSALFVAGGASLLLAVALPLESARALRLALPMPLESDGGHRQLAVPLSLEDLSGQRLALPLSAESGGALSLAVPLSLEVGGLKPLVLAVPRSLESLARTARLSLPLPLEALLQHDLLLRVPLPLGVNAPDHSTLDVTFDVLTRVRAPLYVQFDVVPVETVLDKLAVQFDVVETCGDFLNVTFDVVSGRLFLMRAGDDVQAPVVHVTLT